MDSVRSTELMPLGYSKKKTYDSLDSVEEKSYAQETCDSIFKEESKESIKLQKSNQLTGPELSLDNKIKKPRRYLLKEEIEQYGRTEEICNYKLKEELDQNGKKEETWVYKLKEGTDSYNLKEERTPYMLKEEIAELEDNEPNIIEDIFLEEEEKRNVHPGQSFESFSYGFKNEKKAGSGFYSKPYSTPSRPEQRPGKTINCSKCSFVMSYQPEHYFVTCPICNCITATVELLPLSCQYCRVISYFPKGSQTVQCTCGAVYFIN